MRVALALLVCLPAARAGAAPVRIASVTIDGTPLEAADTLRGGLALSPGGVWDEAVEKRVRVRLDRLGYGARIERADTDRGVALRIVVRPFPVVRAIHVEGTTPFLEMFDAIFESDVRRRIGFRPGQRLPEGADLEPRLREDARRVQDYLRRMGYWDADVEIHVEPTARADWMNLRYVLLKGPRYDLGAVEPTGNAALSTREIRETVEDRYRLLFFRFPFTAERLDEAIDALVERYHERGYPGARVGSDFRPERDLDRLDETARVPVQVRERHHVDLRFEVDGDPVGPDTNETLRSVVTIFRSGSYDEIELGASARELEHHYQLDGRFHARASYERRRATRESETIVFRIDRGPEMRVRAVEFEGNAALSGSALYDVVETRVFTFWRWVKLAAGGYATTLQLKQDERRVADFYRQHGYPDVVVRAEAATDRSALGHAGALAAAYSAGVHHGKDLYVRFTVEEGPHVRVVRVGFDGQTPFRSLLLPMVPHLALRPGADFDRELLRADQGRLLRALAEAGYPYAEVGGHPTPGSVEIGAPVVERTGSRREHARITYAIRWNAPVRFGEIYVRGNFKTSERVIRAELAFAPGDPFDIAKLEESERNLRELGIFSTVRLALVGVDEKAGTAHVVAEVEERYDDWGAFEIGGGASTDNLVFGLLTYRHQNLFGLADALELQTEYGSEIRSGRGTFTDRRLFLTRNQMDVTGFVRSEETERLGDIFTVGASVVLSRQLRVIENMKVYLRYEFQQVRLEKDLFRPGGPVDEPDTVELTPRTGALGPGFVWDWRDRPFAPTCGWSVGGFAQYASPYLGGTETFARLSSNAQMMLPLSRDAKAFGRGCQGRALRGALRAPVTIAQGLRYDHGLPLGGDAFLPAIERFFAGGDTTVRGFEEDLLRATIVEYEVAPGVTAFRAEPQGGNIRVIHNFELWFPLWDKSFVLGLPIVAATFLDSGLVANSFDGFSPADLRHGAGAALRILAPFGFISFEYAWPLDPNRADDPTGRLHLNFGAAFQF